MSEEQWYELEPRKPALDTAAMLAVAIGLGAGGASYRREPPPLGSYRIHSNKQRSKHKVLRAKRKKHRKNKKKGRR